MKKILILVLLIIISLSACKSYPVYEEMKPDPELGFVLNIDGVIYRTLPEVMWEPDPYNQNRIKIGNLDNKNTSIGIYVYELDVNRVFILRYEDKLFIDVAQKNLFYRADVDLPEFCASNVSSLYFTKPGNNSKEKPFDNTITDRQTIEDVFQAINKAKEHSGGGKKSVGNLYINLSEYEGICVILSVWAYQDKYWLDIRDGITTYKLTEISHELIEKLVGEELPTAKEYLEQQTSGE